MREHTEERLNREWNELYGRIKDVLQQYGQDDVDGGEYFVVDEIFSNYVHQIEMHKLHMLRPEIVTSLQILLKDYPDWEIEISVFIPQEDINIEPGEGLTLRDDEIVDALDRELLPKEYRDLKYEGSRPPKGPGGYSNLPQRVIPSNTCSAVPGGGHDAALIRVASSVRVDRAHSPSKTGVNAL